ncbi:MAG: PP2C family serine/threonine-protein phosphatase [Pseudomonadota bacterium]|nr:PP2C family serine/threonine-protein phosphatase [Pseudomonadota bacterium]
MSHVIQNVDSFSHQGYVAVQTPNHYNEDRMVVGTYTFAVIDGATAITPADIDGLNTSAYTSKFLAEFLSANDSSDMDARESMLAANHAFKSHLEAEHPNIIELGKSGPCAAAAMIKIHKNEVSFSNISDCAIVGFKKGEWHVLSTHSTFHADLDKKLSDYIFTESAKGINVNEIRKTEAVRSIIERNRGLTNVKYGVFNYEPEMENFLTGGTFKAGEFTRIVMFSDGLDWPEGKSTEQSLKMAAEKMTEMGVKNYYEMLKEMFASDPTFERYRRLKHMDDATGLVITL